MVFDSRDTLADVVRGIIGMDHLLTCEHSMLVQGEVCKVFFIWARACANEYMHSWLKSVFEMVKNEFEMA